MPTAARSRSPALIALLVALAMNVLNMFEPLTVDDVCHHYYARQVVEHPLAPYEFETHWHQKPEHAWDIMVAPVHSYYWAPLLAVCPDSTAAWKAWFLPLDWLFCWSLLLLLQRWVPRVAVPVLVMTALGPTLLPGINIMLEVPVLAFAFASIVALLRAFDTQQLRWAALAGLLLGLAFQTKYLTMGFTAPWVLLAIVHRRWRELFVGFAAAAATALAIEGLVALSHGGGSYFMRQLELTQRREWGGLLVGLVLNTGWLGMPAAMLALLGLGAPRWAWMSAASLCALAHVAVAAGGDIGKAAVLATAVCTWGTAAWLFTSLALSVLQKLRLGQFGGSTGVRVFLLGWFPAELVSSLVVSPFPAARRTLLPVLAMTVAAGWFVARRRHVAGAVRAIAAGTALLGIGYQGIDFLEGRAVVHTADEAVAYARRTAPDAQVWFTGGWGFEFYAPRAGMKPLLRGQTQVAAGDMVVIGSIDDDEGPWWHWDCAVWQQRVDPVPHLIAALDPVPVPLSTLFAYYSGRRPLTGQSGPRYRAKVYRVREAFHASELTAIVNPWRDH